MLIVVSGPDRVGKSTLICRMQEACGDDAYVAHHSAPPKNQKSIFDFYKEDIEKWLESNKKIAIFITFTSRPKPGSYKLCIFL